VGSFLVVEFAKYRFEIGLGRERGRKLVVEQSLIKPDG